MNFTTEDKKSIVIIGRPLRKGALDGIGWFTYHLANQLIKDQPKCKIHMVYDDPNNVGVIEGANIINHVISFPPTKHVLLILWWMEFPFKRLLDKLNPDLVISPDGIIPLRGDHNFTGVIHDLNYVYYPNELKFSHRLFYKYIMPKYASRANHIVTVSNFSKFDIVKNFGVEEAKISVVYNVLNDHLKIPFTEEERTMFHQKLTGGKAYFLFVGSIIPRKNIPRLIEAFTLFKKQTGAPHQLVIVGSKSYGMGTVNKALKASVYREEVHLVGRVEDRDLRFYYSSATALTYTSLFEGFGIPLIEAKYFNLPIVCSNTSAMPEIGGEGVNLVDPEDVGCILKSLKEYNEKKIPEF